MCYDPLRFILSFSDLFSFFFAAITCPGGVQTLGRGREGVEGSPPPRLPTRAVSLLMLTVLPHLPMTRWHLRICFPPPLCLAHAPRAVFFPMTQWALRFCFPPPLFPAPLALYSAQCQLSSAYLLMVPLSMVGFHLGQEWEWE